MADTKVLEVVLKEEGASHLNEDALNESLQRIFEHRYGVSAPTPPDFTDPSSAAAKLPKLPELFDPSSAESQTKKTPDPSDLFGSIDTDSIDPAKLGESIEALKKEFDTLSAASQAAAKSGQASAASTAGMADSAAAAASALGGGGGSGAGGGGGAAAGAAGASGGGIGAAGGLAAAAAGAAVVLTDMVAAGYAFNKAVDGMVASMGQLSGEVQAAVARGTVQKVQDDLRAARETGGILSALVDTRNEIASELRGISREALEAFGPAMNAMGRLIELGLSGIRIPLEALNEAIDFLNALASEAANGFPELQGAVDRVAANTKPKFKVNMEGQELMDALFDLTNLGVQSVDWNAQTMDMGDPRL